MIRVLIGSVAGGVTMFVVAMIFWATPLSGIAFAGVDDARGATLQAALAANLPVTGRYSIPNPATAQGAVLYGRGPVAVIDYNRGGFSMSDGAMMLGGFIHEVVVSLMIGLSLLAVAGRVTDFASRLRLAIGLSAAATVMITLSDPIWMHQAWQFAIYNLIACLAMLAATSFVIVRWFLPAAASRTV